MTENLRLILGGVAGFAICMLIYVSVMLWVLPWAVEQRMPWQPDYTPPTFQEFEAAIGGTDEDFGENLQRYELMRLAMSAHTYDRDEAFRRLANIKERSEEQDRLMAELRSRLATSPKEGT